MKDKPVVQKITDNKIVERIYLLRGQKVMLDNDLAEMYGVDTKVLNQAVKRNAQRFPKDFMFQLTKNEWEALRSQIVTLEEKGRGRYPKYLPKVFTEQGVAMLSSVLRSETAIQVNIQISKPHPTSPKGRSLISFPIGKGRDGAGPREPIGFKIPKKQ